MRDLIVPVLIVVVVVVVVVGWGWFYWTECAFTLITEAPVICVSGR